MGRNALLAGAATTVACLVGQFSVEVPSSDRADEIGEMAKTGLTFRDGLRLIDDIANQANLLALNAMIGAMPRASNPNETRVAYCATASGRVGGRVAGGTGGVGRA